MDTKAFNQLLKQAQDDPKFFHDLVFNTESVLANLDYLDRNSKAALVAISPEELIGTLVGDVFSCDVTCTSSCGATCNKSCGYTTNFEMPDIYSNPVQFGIGRRRFR